ncbi:MAG: hypothetical protein V1876_01315 [Candidatus Peregrinibacteria bacterium]
MSYVLLFLAGFLAGIGAEWFQRRSIWDNVELGCFHGCLIACGILTAFCVFCVLAWMRLHHWMYALIPFAGFFGTLILLRFYEYLEGIWRNRSP